MRVTTFAAPRRVVRTSATGDVTTFEALDGRGPTVVLVHDLASPRGVASVAEVFQALRSSRRVVAVELPGCGDSVAPAQPWDREPYVAALAEVLEDVARLRGGLIDVVGFGVGGELAARAVRRRPAVVRSIALLAPTGYGVVARLARAVGARGFTLASSVLAALGASVAAVADPWVADDVYADLPVPHVLVAAPFDAPVALAAFWRSLAPRPRLRLVEGGLAGAREHGDRHGHAGRARTR